MVFPAFVRDAHLLMRVVNRNIRSVEPPCRVSKPSRSQQFEKIIKGDSSFELWRAEDNIGSIECRRVALIQNLDPFCGCLTCSNGPRNSQHCYGDTELPHLVP